MPDMYNTYEAKTHLSALMERAARGESIVLAKAGKPQCQLVPVIAGQVRPGRKSKLGKKLPDDSCPPATPASGRRVLDPKKPKRLFGLAKGKIWIADDFDDPMPEFESSFYNSTIEPPRRRK